MKAFVIDLTKCTGCHDCQIGCKDEHCGNDWMPYAKPQPDTGQFWMKLNQYERGARPHVKVSHLPVLCQHCDNAPCMTACKTEGAIYKREDGLVIIDPAKCNGCGDCVDACPYDTIFFNKDLNLAQKCTGCAHLIDRKWPIAVPRCMDNCHVDVIRFGEESELDLTGTEILHPEYGTKPRVYYKGLPKKFIAGTVYDPIAKEVIIGATCTLTGEGGQFTAKTDNFGDFWLKDLPEADFTLTIKADGKTKTIEVSTKAKDIGLGDIALA
jgi:Fe-S-cluster-containing dehydrogenase component